MAALIDEGLLAAVAIIGTPDKVAKTIVQRYQGRMDRVSLLGYIKDPALAAQVVTALRRAID